MNLEFFTVTQEARRKIVLYISVNFKVYNLFLNLK